MPPFRAAIFDLDGTLLDTLEDLADSANHMLRQRGYPVHPVEAYRYFVGDGVRVLMERILPAPFAADEEALEECMRIYKAAYQERWNRKSRLYPGVSVLLDALTRQGVQLAVLSNKPHPFTVQVVESFLGAWPWQAVHGMRDGVPKKPDPAGAINLLRILNVSAEETLYFGDTDTDMLTARAAGLYPVGVLWGFREREELTRTGARLLLESPEDILQDPSIQLGGPGSD